MLLAVIFSELHEKPKGSKDLVTEKITQKNFCERLHFLTARPPFYIIFCCFLCLFPFLSDVLVEWLSIKIYNIAMSGIMLNVEKSLAI